MSTIFLGCWACQCALYSYRINAEKVYGAHMNHDDLKYLLEHSAAIRLLRAQSAPFILSALYRLFRRDSQHRWYVALSDAVDSFCALLVVLNARDERYPHGAENYLQAWASDDSG